MHLGHSCSCFKRPELSGSDDQAAAYLGSLEMSLPFFCGEDGLCVLLDPLLGDVIELQMKTLGGEGFWHQAAERPGSWKVVGPS